MKKCDEIQALAKKIATLSRSSVPTIKPAQLELQHFTLLAEMIDVMHKATLEEMNEPLSDPCAKVPVLWYTAAYHYDEVAHWILISHPKTALCTLPDGRNIFHYIAAMHCGISKKVIGVFPSGYKPLLDMPFRGRYPIHKSVGFAGGALETLLELGASVDMRNKFGKTPLHVASLIANREQVCLLLDRKANPNTLDWYGLPPLHYAAIERGDVGVTRALLRAGAEPRMIDVGRPTLDDNIKKTGNAKLLVLVAAGSLNEKAVNQFLQVADDIQNHRVAASILGWWQDASVFDKWHVKCDAPECYAVVQSYIDANTAREERHISDTHRSFL